MENEDRLPLKGVRVSHHLSFFEGQFGCTAVEWGKKKGPLDFIDTIVVSIDGKISAEYPFFACKAVIYRGGGFDRTGGI